MSRRRGRESTRRAGQYLARLLAAQRLQLVRGAWESGAWSVGARMWAHQGQPWDRLPGQARARFARAVRDHLYAHGRGHEWEPSLLTVARGIVEPRPWPCACGQLPHRAGCAVELDG